MRRLLAILLAAALSAPLSFSQTSRREIYADIYRTGSNYFAYPGPVQKNLTAAPSGYEPFFISHYGRHGSRYMSSNKYYVSSIEALEKAEAQGLLSSKGKEVLSVLKKGYANAFNRDGDLTALGGQQHREIARRMYERFPELLSRPVEVDARSSTSRRVMISMFNFCGELQSLNPHLEIAMDASSRDMKWVVEDLDIKPAETPASAQYEKKRAAIMEKAHDSRRLMKSLFTDPKKAESFVKGRDLMEALYNVAEDLQNVPELGISLIGIFTKEELFSMWTGYNAGWLLNTGLVPGSTPYYLQQKEVMDSILVTADRHVREGAPGLSLRFSHDSSVLPLAYLLGLKEAMGGVTDIDNIYKYISIDKIIPMAANIQIIFYRKEGSDDVLVKFLLNENETSVPVRTDCAPYYHWKDVREYYRSRFRN